MQVKRRMTARSTSLPPRLSSTLHNPLLPRRDRLHLFSSSLPRIKSFLETQNLSNQQKVSVRRSTNLLPSLELALLSRPLPCSPPNHHHLPINKLSSNHFLPLLFTSLLINFQLLSFSTGSLEPPRPSVLDDDIERCFDSKEGASRASRKLPLGFRDRKRLFRYSTKRIQGCK